jgi:hypothetical protein
MTPLEKSACRPSRALMRLDNPVGIDLMEAAVGDLLKAAGSDSEGDGSTSGVVWAVCGAYLGVYRPGNATARLASRGEASPRHLPQSPVGIRQGHGRTG